MHRFLKQLKKCISEHKLLNNGDKVVVGFSGGADSTALLFALWKIRDELTIEIVAAHINYNLRGKDSVADMRFAQDFCRNLNIELSVKEVQMGSSSDLENRARKERFDFFDTLCSEKDKIALGHNKEDVGETIFLHLLRGSGITGMRGILPLNGNLIRPLLCFTRLEIEDFLTDSGITNWCNDKTNFETEYTRNKIRLELIPYIQKEINPNIVELLYQNSQIFAGNEEYLKNQSQKVLDETLLSSSKDEVRLSLSGLKQQDKIIIYYVIRKGIELLCRTDYSLTNTNFNDIVGLFETDGSKEISLANGVLVEKGYECLTIYRAGCKKKLDKTGLTTVDINTQSYEFDNYKLLFRQTAVASLDKEFCKNRSVAVMDIDSLILPLTVGYRKQGDCFVPLGMTGKKKLKDFFIDEKISKYERDKILIIRDQEKIVWLAGLRLDDRVKISKNSNQALVIRLKQLDSGK